MGVFDKASLALVPDGIKDGKLYSIKPTDGSGDFTFSRGSNLAATRVDENGLIEKGRENFIEFSNDFSTSKTPFNVTVSSGEAGYDGTNNAWKLIKGSSSGDYLRWIKSGGLGNVVFTYSIYVKAGSLSYFVIWTTGGNQAYFELTGNGSVTYTQGSNLVDSKIESVGNGWYRCSLTTYPEASEVRLYPTTDGTPGVAGGTSGDFVYIQNFQAEYGLVATEYIDKVDYVTGGLAGILEDLPRIDYTGSTPSLLMEPSRTNLIDHSEYLKGNSEFKVLSSSVTFADYTETSPEGNTNALRILETSGTGNHNWYYDNLSGFTNGVTYTFSFFAKSINGRNIRFDEGGVGMDMQGIIDLSNGSILQDAHSNVSVESYGNGWYRVSAVGTMNGTVQRIIFNTTDGTTTSFPGDTTKGVSLWGVQIEQASYPTSYIPTYGATATRSSDYYSNTSLSNIGSTDRCTFYCEIDLPQGREGFQRFFRLDSSTSSFAWKGNHVEFPVISIIGTGNITGSGAFTVSAGVHKLIVRWENGVGSIFVDGVKKSEQTTSSTTEVFDEFESQGTGYRHLQKSVLVFPEALSDAECITLTT